MKQQYVECGQGATCLLARPVHGKGTCQPHGWAGELCRAVGSLRAQIVPASRKSIIVSLLSYNSYYGNLMLELLEEWAGERFSGDRC